MKKLFFLGLLLSNFFGLAQYTLIPDVNFEKALISQGIDSGAIDGKVLTAKISTLVGLDVSGKNISDLSGIQDFISLYTLICSDNKLTQLDVSKNTILNGLSCSNNQLQDINVLANSNLESLSVINNQLTDLDISQNNNLKSLFCYDNKLTKLDVSKNFILENLLCYSNKITSLDISKNTLLKHLSSGINELTSLDVTKNTALTILTCYKNKISSLDVTKNTSLLNLGCSSNQLTSLDTSKNLSLQILSCHSNPISVLDLSNNKDLYFLECESTQLSSLNLKNKNNIKFTVIRIFNNPNLKCIQVDNKAYSDANWSANKDATASFSDNCGKTTPPPTPPKITATGNQIFCKDKPLNIIPTVSIAFDPLEPDTEAVYVQISSGYVAGSDLLSLRFPATHSAKNIFPIWDSNTGKLKLYSPTGSKILYKDFEAALKDVIFSNSQTTPSGARTFSITIGQANYLPSTGHYYEYVPSLGINWNDAKAAAESRTYFGLRGYLATVLSADEAQLTGKQSSGAGWIGGSDAAIDGVWRWVTGPEGLADGGRGVVFWNGLANGTSPNFAFWNTNEPNQFNGANEDYTHITAPGIGITGSWNDLTLNGDPSGSYKPQGYIVEYGGMPGDPKVEIAASTSITIPTKIEFESTPICFSGSITLKPKDFSENIRWYNVETGGTVLSIANIYSPNISTTTSYFADTYDGYCPLNPRIKVIAKVISPTVTSPTPTTPICGSGKATLTATGSAGSTLNWYSAATGGTSLNTSSSYTTLDLTKDTSFYVDATESTCMSKPRTIINVSVKKIPSITGTTPATRCDNGTVSLEATADFGTLNWYDIDKGGTVAGTGNTFTTPSLTTTTPFYVETTDGGCTSSPRTEVTASIIILKSDTKEVILCPTRNETLDALAAGLDYVWSPGGETTQKIDVTSIGTYEVTISSPTSSACGSKKIFNVIEHPKPVIKELLVNKNSVTIVLTNPKDYYEFSIDGVLFQKSNRFNFIPSGAQIAYVQENNSCNLTSLPFTIFSIAQYFTPNNDGINDTWLIPEMKNYPGSNVKIFNRYGKLLKQMNAGTVGWNGQFNNLDLPADDYWFVLQLDPTQPEIKGHFTLKR